MVNSGLISFIVETGGGFDGNGNPIPSTKVPSSFISCNLAVTTRKYELYANGQWQNSSYRVVVENINIQAIIGNQNIKTYLSAVKEIKLQDTGNNALGDFQVQSMQFLDLTNKVKFVV